MNRIQVNIRKDVFMNFTVGEDDEIMLKLVYETKGKIWSSKFFFQKNNFFRMHEDNQNICF
jgi:hypothetical protein